MKTISLDWKHEILKNNLSKKLQTIETFYFLVEPPTTRFVRPAESIWLRGWAQRVKFSEVLDLCQLVW